MKKVRLISILVLIAILLSNICVYANMAAPKKSDIASTITFESNDKISVVSEILDITVKGAQADIVATYKMKNNADESVTVQSMFLSPNIKTSGVKVRVNNKDVVFTSESYLLSYDTEVETNDWQYAVLSKGETATKDGERTVDTITFNMDFLAYEEYEVVVSYSYMLGGYPDYDFDAKNGIIEYYLAPAAMWQGFSNLTINLYLDKDMPIIKSSNLDFKRIGDRTYQYTSEVLPKENLRIEIDENWWLNIFSTLRNPYLYMFLSIILPFILIVVVIIILVIVWKIYKKKKKK